MRAVAIVDTSVLLNLVPVPGENQQQEQVAAEFKRLVDSNTALLLPVATLIETGNHIARLADGGQRHRTATKFAKLAIDELDGKSPFTATAPPEIRAVIERFAEFAKQTIGLADLSIIGEYERLVKLNPGRRVSIWSLDDHLAGYVTEPQL